MDAAAANMEPEISIHAPREGSDHLNDDFLFRHGSFLSTLPARGATHPHLHTLLLVEISIHAPREGSDTDASHLGGCQ